MNPRKILPQGGIQSGDSVILGTFIGNILHVYTTNGFEQAYNGVTLVPGIQILSISVNTNYATFASGTTMGGLTYNSTGQVTLSGVMASPVFLNETAYEGFDFPRSVTAGIQYYPSGVSSDMLTSIPLQFLVAEQYEYTRLVILPARYFTDCSTSANTPSTDLTTVVALTQCSYYPATAYCSNYSGKTAWTNVEECIVGNTYEYCTSTSPCNGNCNSACPNPGDKCVFNGTSYSCVPNVQTVQMQVMTAPQVPASMTWLWVLLAIVILVVVGFLVYYLFFDEPPKETYVASHSYQHHHPR